MKLAWLSCQLGLNTNMVNLMRAPTIQEEGCKELIQMTAYFISCLESC